MKGIAITAVLDWSIPRWTPDSFLLWRWSTIIEKVKFILKFIAEQSISYSYNFISELMWTLKMWRKHLTITEINCFDFRVSKNYIKAKSHICEYCAKSFSCSSLLSHHLKVHTGEKPFSCSLCTKSFGLANHLKRHWRVHTGEKPYTCPQCSRSFATSDKLRQHLKVHTGEKPYSCPHCLK